MAALGDSHQEEHVAQWLKAGALESGDVRALALVLNKSLTLKKKSRKLHYSQFSSLENRDSHTFSTGL